MVSPGEREKALPHDPDQLTMQSVPLFIPVSQLLVGGIGDMPGDYVRPFLSIWRHSLSSLHPVMVVLWRQSSVLSVVRSLSIYLHILSSLWVHFAFPHVTAVHLLPGGHFFSAHILIVNELSAFNNCSCG